LISAGGVDVSPTVTAVIAAGASLGWSLTIEPSNYEFQKGGDQMLVIAANPHGS
jgi:hypothetical protein